MAAPAGRRYRYADAFAEAGGWFTAFGALFSGSWSLMYKWERPHMYVRPSHNYARRDKPFPMVDGMGRKKNNNHKPFECTVNPDSGAFEHLLVQATKDICSVANSSWRRTIIRNISPMFLRAANIPYKLIDRSRRNDTSQYTAWDWWSIVLLWPVAMVAILLYIFIRPFHSSQPQRKDISSYLPFLYQGYKYPLLAKNLKENRKDVEQVYDADWLSGQGPYRSLRPRYLCVLDKNDKAGFRMKPVKEDDDIPYVFIAYTTEHFGAGPDEKERARLEHECLLSLAVKATEIYEAEAVARDELPPEAFWLAAQCMPYDKDYNDDGDEIPLKDSNTQKLMNSDTYSISDIIRAAERVIVIAGNPERKRPGPSITDHAANMAALAQWGKRAWTLPEVLLSRGNSVDVLFAAQGKPEMRTINKEMVASMVWPDAAISRQLVDHFATLHLSRLELVNVAWECLKKRERGMTKKYAGDLSYILMGLLRLRPPIDIRDSPFQAFGRLSLPQDSDRLMERLILLLPHLLGPSRAPGDNMSEREERPWEEMTDQYNARLWDIYPSIQVCGIGEADTVIVDGFKGALIQWSQFSPVRTLLKGTLRRRMVIFMFKYPLFILTFAIIGFVFPNIPYFYSMGVFCLLWALTVLLLGPLVIPWLFRGKFWDVEPCLFGIEGFVPVDEIERRLFGAKLNRLKWSTNFSPLSRHGPGAAGPETKQKYYDTDRDRLLGQPVDETITTCLVEGRNPLLCGSCSEDRVGCRAGGHKTYDEVRKQSHRELGEVKIFTLVDTMSMTATLFEARRPPIALLVGGSEGGMKRALACSYDITSGVLYRETVLRIPTAAVDSMHSMPRLRIGLHRRFHDIAPR